MVEARKTIFKNKTLIKSIECVERECASTMTKEEFETVTDFIAELLLKNYLREAKISVDK